MSFEHISVCSAFLRNTFALIYLLRAVAAPGLC